MIIDFDEKTHCYAVNGDIASISVTELLKKHGLSTDYGDVPKKTMVKAAEHGKAVHKDLEKIMNALDYVPETTEGINYAEWVKQDIDCGRAEQMVAYDYKGMIVAGTADLVGIMKDGKLIVADSKTTAKVNKEAVSWQVSLIDYMFRKLQGEPINGHSIYWKGADRLLCLAFDKKTGAMSVIDLDKVPDIEIERLLEAEYNGDKYQRPSLVLDKDMQLRVEQVESALILAQSEYIAAQEQAHKIRAELCKAFEAQGITKWESPNGIVKVAYVPKTTAITVDSAKLKAEYPQVWSKCQKATERKAYVKVTVADEL